MRYWSNFIFFFPNGFLVDSAPLKMFLLTEGLKCCLRHIWSFWIHLHPVMDFLCYPMISLLSVYQSHTLNYGDSIQHALESTRDSPLFVIFFSHVFHATLKCLFFCMNFNRNLSNCKNSLLHFYWKCINFIN